MSEDDKPIFPRPIEKSDEEKQKLYQETRQKLESAEQKVFCGNCETEAPLKAKFCRKCGIKLALPPESGTVKSDEKSFLDELLILIIKSPPFFPSKPKAGSGNKHDRLNDGETFLPEDPEELLRILVVEYGPPPMNLREDD